MSTRETRRQNRAEGFVLRSNIAEAWPLLDERGRAQARSQRRSHGLHDAIIRAALKSVRRA